MGAIDFPSVDLPGLKFRKTPWSLSTSLPVDPMGIGYGPEYVSKLKAGRDSNFTTDSFAHSRKNDARWNALGLGERAMVFILEVSPFVLAYRTQYPWLLAHARKLVDDYVCGLVDDAPELTRRDLISMDFVVTTEENGKLNYVILSHKLTESLTEKRVKKRLRLEQHEAASVGFKHVVFSRSRLLDRQGLSAKQIMVWGRKTDFDAVREEAEGLAKLFYSSYQGESLCNFLDHSKSRFGFDIHTAFTRFSAAVHLGYLHVDLSTMICDSTPIRLLDSKEAKLPWIVHSGKGSY